MGSHDGAEICELVGLFLLHKIREKFPSLDLGLYRDDGLGAQPDAPGPTSDRFRKDMIALFKKYKLSITLDVNLIQVNMLDATFNMEKDTFWPYRKPNDQPCYINTQSNHPQNIIRDIPKMIGKRLSSLSHNEEVFNDTIECYQDALSKSGHSTALIYDPSVDHTKRKRNRKREITWFNPPFNRSVTTNIGKIFFNALAKYFPKNNRYHKIFNKNTVKLSYSCTSNMKSKISAHNKKLLSNEPNQSETPRTCNCQVPKNCPLNGTCLSSAIVYRGTVTCDDITKTYIGGTETTFKERHGNHKKSFNLAHYSHETKISEYVWAMKRNGYDPNVTWSIVKKCVHYKAGDKFCDTCVSEALEILREKTSKGDGCINKRSELSTTCRHKAKFKLHKAHKLDY